MFLTFQIDELLFKYNFSCDGVLIIIFYITMSWAQDNVRYVAWVAAASV